MRDFFAFRTMITSSVIQVVFVLGLIGIVIGSIGAIANDQAAAGLLILIFGGLYWRILCELLIVVFRMNSSLNAISQNTAGLAPASVNMLGHRKAKRLRKNQRESLYPHLAGDRYCGLSIPTHSHLRCRKRLRQ